MNTFLKTALALFALILTSHAMASSASEAVFDRKLEQAETGDAEAQYDVGYRFEKGRGVDEDEDEAFAWYSKSAAQGMDKGQYKVGICYLKGSGIDQDLEVARVWLQKAAGQGYPPAQYQLGKLLASKRNKDYSGALVWLQKAQDNGYEPATGAIRKVKRKLN
jgi:TPR repeat protein